MPVEETSLAPQNSSVATLAHDNPVREALTSGQFCYFVELVASATMREARLLEIASHLARVPAVVAGGITSFAGGALGQNPVRISAAARARGLSPNLHLTCVSRDRLDLRNTLEDMNALGIENVFAITGDYPKATAATSTPYFHLDSVQLVEMINELRQTAGMIEMGMAVQQQLHVFDVIAQGLDIRFDHRCGFRQAAIGQDQALRRDDQECADAGGADIIDVADNMERGLRLVPFQARAREWIGRLCLHREAGRCHGDACNQKFLHADP